SYYSYLKACNLFLEVLYKRNHSKEIEKITEIEELLDKLEDFEIPLRTQQLLFWYFDYTGQYGKAEEMLFDMLESEAEEDFEDVEDAPSLLEKGEAFYASLVGKSDEALAAGNLPRTEISAGLARLHTHFML
ncbi:MAG: DUF6483 family protein, partial [Ktedonobacteraceae bacterium]